mmetsp:Transcript_18143/g.36945  ORF Transcript_18143/g.36945 Transcript_18143/m.36945 type:complete len:156 (-) Transcript_18143:69-536(-)
MGNELLRMLMTICLLGAAWKEDPTKIPVDAIAEEWRSQSSKGRYEAAMWREAGLQEEAAAQSLSGGELVMSGGTSGGSTGGGSTSNGTNGGTSGGSCDTSGSSCGTSGGNDGDAEVDNFAAAGVFAWLGRNGAESRGEHAGTSLGTRRMTTDGLL